MRNFLLTFLILLQCIPFVESPNDPTTPKGLLKRILFLFSPKQKEYLLISDSRYLYILDPKDDEIIRSLNMGIYPIAQPKSLNPNTGEIAFLKLTPSEQVLTRYYLFNYTEEPLIHISINNAPLLSFDTHTQFLNLVNQTSSNSYLLSYSLQSKEISNPINPFQCPSGTYLDHSNFLGFSFSVTQFFVGNSATASKSLCSYSKTENFLFYSSSTSLGPYTMVSALDYNYDYNKVFLLGVDTNFATYKIVFDVRNPEDGSYYSSGDSSSDTNLNSNYGLYIESFVYDSVSKNYIVIVRRIDAVINYYHFVFLNDLMIRSSLPFFTTTASVNFSYAKVSKNRKLYISYREGTICYLKAFSLDYDFNNSLNPLTFLRDIYLPYTTECNSNLELETIEGIEGKTL